MTKKFNILEHNKQKINKALIMDGCERFISIFCDSIKEYHPGVRKTLVEELYKGSTISKEGDKTVITLRFPKDD